MNNFAQISKRLNQLSVLADNIKKSSYETFRDGEGNLFVNFQNGKVIKLPPVDFRPHQIALQKKLFVDKILRHAISRPRRSGKEVESWNLLIESAVEKPGMYFMVYPTNVRAKKILWEGSVLINNESMSFLKMIPSEFFLSKNNSEMTIKLINGSIIWIMGSDIDPDKLRGTNPLGIVFAEFAFQDPHILYSMLPVLRQNGGWLICQSTFDGQNHFYQLIKDNKANPLWNCVVDSVVNLVDENGNRYITDEMIQEDRDAGMPEYLIQQEYYGSVEINQETKYFALAMKHIFDNEKIVPNLVLPNKNVYAAWDLGVNDFNWLLLFQLDEKGWPIIIDCLYNNNRDLLYYVDESRKIAARNNLCLKTHFLPHDGDARKVLNIGNKTTASQMRELGENVIVVERPRDKIVSIEEMRKMLFMTYFNKEKTQRLIDCLCNYSKEYNEKMGTYKNYPVHNWASHGVDAYQTMTLAIVNKLIPVNFTEIVYNEF